MQQQMPVRLGGFPKSDPNSYQFLCRHIFPPRLPFKYIFDISVDQYKYILDHLCPSSPFETQDCCAQRLSFPDEGNCKVSEYSSSLFQKKKDFTDQSEVHLWCQQPKLFPACEQFLI